jgi:hypothetical protein
LELANSSEYPGERANALDAARRLAQKHGLTLEEAARGGLEPVHTAVQPQDNRADARVGPMYFAWVQQEQMGREKRRWEEAVQRARTRGLDGGPDGLVRARPQWRPQSRARRNPRKHAEVLLAETRLPIREIAAITGLDIYSVVGMKLKMRAEV